MLTLIALVVALLFLSWPWNVIVVVVAAAVDIAETGGFVWWARRGRGLHPAAAGLATVVGAGGVVVARIAAGGDTGQGRVDGEIWAARATGTLDPGAEVVVTGVDGLVLHVAPEAP